MFVSSRPFVRTNRKSNPWLSSSALAGEQEHLLPTGRGNQAVTEELLQGGNVLRAQMMFSFMLAAETSSLRICKNCMKSFFASDDAEAFCCPECEAEYNENQE